MSADDTTLREHVRSVVMERLDQGDDRREEAIREFLNVTMAADPAATARAAQLVPKLMGELYEKWVGMFVERFFETVPGDQVELLCDGTDENNAAICLVYIMFLESERMEKQIDDDLKAYGLEMTGADDTGDLAASYIRAKMAQMGKKLKSHGDS